MLQLKEAVELLQGSVQQVTDTELIPLRESLGRVLGEDCVAHRAQPPFPRSPLDGYAVRGADTAGASRSNPIQLTVIGKLFAGQVFFGTVGPGEAVRIMTGAPIPEGADTVIRQEDTDCNKQVVSLYRSSEPYENYCPAGETYPKGALLLKKGTLLNAVAVSFLAGLGQDWVRVLRRPQIGVISTGDEVLEPGAPPEPGKIYDSNRWFVTSRLTELGCEPSASLHTGDDALCLAREIEHLSDFCQLIITTGGVSVGEKDILHQTLELLGARRLFWKVAVKPGSPTLAAVYRSTLLLCLSGNPFGAAAHFELLARPVLAALTGLTALDTVQRTAALMDSYPKGAKMSRLLRGFCQGHRVWLTPPASDALGALVRSNCFVELPPRREGFSAGEKVRVFLL